MINRSVLIRVALLCVIASGDAFAQTLRTDGGYAVFMRVAPSAGSACNDPKLTKPVEKFLPLYPPEAKAARVAGSVKVEILLDANGEVRKIVSARGPKMLIREAKKAARANKFSGSICDGITTPLRAVLTFNFVANSVSDIYTYPGDANGYADVATESPFYEPISVLTRDYALTYGYADGGFHPATPLKKGDFAHFLRLTLDLLQKRAEEAGKIPREIDLYFPINPQSFPSTDVLIDFNPGGPYAESVEFLISKYDIALASEGRMLEGERSLTYDEVIGYWRSIFGNDAIPVNFKRSEEADRIMSRGEFALFLRESLYVLTYKVIP